MISRSKTVFDKEEYIHIVLKYSHNIKDINLKYLFIGSLKYRNLLIYD